MMSLVLEGLTFASVYIDGVVVLPKILDEHISDFNTLMERISEQILNVNSLILLCVVLYHNIVPCRRSSGYQGRSREKREVERHQDLLQSR